MRRLLSWCGCLTLLVTTVGCAVCANPHDCDYAAYGGIRQRADRVRGRVASVYDPALEVSQGTSVEQSPPAPSRPAGETDVGPSFESAPEVTPQPIPAPEAGSPLPGSARPESSLPEVPGGTIELPDPAVDDLPMPDSVPNPSTLPPDLPGNGDRSAGRHPLQDLFADEP